MTGINVFDTALGAVGIAWTERGVCGVQLPEGSVAATRARLLRRFPDAREVAPSGSVARAIADIVALLEGEPRDLSSVELDEHTLPEFQRRVYAVTRAIGPGSTLEYGDIARQLGDPLAARAVGQALGQNPYPIIVPCHRVLAAGQRAGGFSARGGVTTKLRLLEIERRRLPFELT
jgi:methylated-DNA-[protein]-cysteine S-methyltransferase